MSNRKVVKTVPAREGFLVKLECGHKRYAKTDKAKTLKCETCVEIKKGERTKKSR